MSRKSVDDHGSTRRVLFTEENSDGEFLIHVMNTVFILN